MGIYLGKNRKWPLSSEEIFKDRIFTKLGETDAGRGDIWTALDSEEIVSINMDEQPIIKAHKR